MAKECENYYTDYPTSKSAVTQSMLKMLKSFFYGFKVDKLDSNLKSLEFLEEEGLV